MDGAWNITLINGFKQYTTHKNPEYMIAYLLKPNATYRITLPELMSKLKRIIIKTNW